MRERWIGAPGWCSGQGKGQTVLPRVRQRLQPGRGQKHVAWGTVSNVVSRSRLEIAHPASTDRSHNIDVRGTMAIRTPQTANCSTSILDAMPAATALAGIFDELGNAEQQQHDANDDFDSGN